MSKGLKPDGRQLQQNREIMAAMQAAQMRERGRQAAAAKARMDSGNQAIDFLVSLVKVAPGGQLRISSLVKDRPGPRDGFVFGHDDEKNEWTCTYGEVPEEPAEAPGAPSSNVIALPGASS